MKLLSFRSWAWEADGYRFGVPVGFVPTQGIQPQIIPRAGATASFGTSVITEMVIPGEVIYQGPLSYEAAWRQFFRRIAVLDTEPGDLVALMNDGTQQTIRALPMVPPGTAATEVNAIPVAFVTVDAFWQAAAGSSASGVATALAPTIAVAYDGDVPAPATVRLAPVAQRGTPTANVGWKRRRVYRLTNNGDQPLTNYPWAIDLGLTNALVTGGKALASGNDLRVVRDGVEQARLLVDWNSGSLATLCWAIVPELGPGKTIDFEVWYSNPGAGGPPLLVGDALPVFDVQTAGAGRSTNAVRRYRVNPIAANAGYGLWRIERGDRQPGYADYSAPGSWSPAATFGSPNNYDDAAQPPYRTYVVSLVGYWQAALDATRAREASLAAPETGEADGVAIGDPLGVVSVRSDYTWQNDETGPAGSVPVGKFVVLYRNDLGGPWTVLAENPTKQTTPAAVAAATWSPPGGRAAQVALAVWPYDGSNVPPSATAGRIARAWQQTVCEVTIDAGRVAVSTVQAEEEIYELAAQVSLDLGGEGGLDATLVRIGNALAASGAGTPRVALRLTETAEIEAATRRARVLTAALVRDRDVPSVALAAIDVALAETGTEERASARALPVRPVGNAYTVTEPATGGLEVDILWTTRRV